MKLEETVVEKDGRNLSREKEKRKSESYIM